MGLFGNLFAKKNCDICGGEIGLLGNRKLEDGNCCKDCARKLSPWFDERRHSTVAQINEQLAYRAENAQKLAGFRAAQIIGDDYKMYVEEVNGVPTRFFVTRSDSYMEANPDIIEFKDLMSCTTDVRTNERELKRDDGNGNRVSYNPPRYETDYDFYINMNIANNPYFDDIRFRINTNTVTLETRGGSTGSLFGINFTSGPVNVSSAREQELYQKYTGMCQQIEYIVQRSRGQAAPVGAPYGQPQANPYAQPQGAQYGQPQANPYAQPQGAQYGQPQANPYAQPQSAPAAPYAQPAAVPATWTCAGCGTTNSGNFCEGCGAKRP